MLQAASIGLNPLGIAQEYGGDGELPGRMVASPPDHVIPYDTAVYLFHRHDVREVTQLGAAVFLFHRHAMQAQFAELGPEVVREQVVAVDLGRARRDFRGDEGLDGVAQRIDGVAQVEVQAGIVHGVCLL